MNPETVREAERMRNVTSLAPPAPYRMYATNELEETR